jgi:outer membrane lipoprotein-sorting protein
VDHTDDARITVARGGPETVEGTATMSYNLTIETQGRQFRQKLYVATATGYPRRLEMSSDQGTVTIDYFDFDAPITINPPC